MVAKNLASTFGGATSASRVQPLEVHRPAIVDGRMSPHEWLRRPDGSLSKSDGTAHGDDHFFPGPTDIAWDLAGVIVEWRLDASATERLFATYERASGDDPRGRIAPWLRAYSAIRLALTTVGMHAARGTPEEARLAREAATYRGWAASPAAAPT